MDDMVVMGNTQAAVDCMRVELQKSFEITDQGEVSWLLGFEIRCDRAT